MKTNDEYYVYTGFVLGLRIAEAVLEGELGYRCEEIADCLRAYEHGEVLASDSDNELLRHFPLSQNDEHYEGGIHPVLTTAAHYALEWRREDREPPLIGG
ncbi:MAG: hypothetical protein KDA63_12175 [Planctomycetales bacterium]|nr:hypothetical protein [Planctomycetales bacterium]